MNRAEAVKIHIEMFGKKPSHFMKDATLYRKIGVEQELIKEEPKKETIEKPRVVTTKNVYEPQEENNGFVKPEKMTTKQYNYFKNKGLL